jgi:hypothetical protein
MSLFDGAMESPTVAALVATSTQPETLRDLLARFPIHSNGSRWPGLRMAMDSLYTVRVVRCLDGVNAEVKGVRGRDARRTYATIDLDTGAISGGSDKLRGMLAGLYADPVGFCERHGRQWCMCCFCWSPLSTLESRERGYGPTCAAHYGLPWG